MAKLRTIRLGLLLFSLGACAAAQDNSQQGAAPAPAFGQSAPVLNPENPPLSGVDEPSLDLKKAIRSFISPAIQVGETADSNENNQLGASSVKPVEHVLGALDLQKFWPKSDLILEYLGGGAFQSNPEYRAQQLQAFGLEAVTRWRTGYLKLRDSFSYIPDGAFDVASAEGFPGLGIALGGGVGIGGLPGAHAFGTGAFEAVGDIPRLANTVILEGVQAISPRSALTLAGAFSNAHFYDNTAQLINSDQTTVEGGYSHMISRHDQIAEIYAFQLFRFPYSTGGEIYNQVLNVRWSHTISGRMRLVLGAGPQYADLHYGGNSSNWTVNGRAILSYEFQRSSLVAAWEKLTTAGSGIFAGANTQSAYLLYRRSLARTFTLSAKLGYARNERLQFFGAGPTPASSDNEGIAGLILRKHLGRTYDAVAAYSFNEVEFDVPGGTACGALGCGNLAQRHRGSIGFEWHPKPTRIE